MKRARTFSGFTLIELLVVIAIIAILAAILFPVFATAREKARQTTCLNNEKQIGLAIMQYVSDYDEFYPMSNWGGGTTAYSGPTYSWRMEVYPYVQTNRVFQCPSVTTTAQDVSGYAGSTVSFYEHYSCNWYIMRAYDGCLSPGTNGVPVPICISQVPSPASTLMVMGTKSSANQVVPQYLENAIAGCCGNNLGHGHFAMWPVIYADGHCKAIKVNTTGNADSTNQWTWQANLTTCSWNNVGYSAGWFTGSPNLDGNVEADLQ